MLIGKQKSLCSTFWEINNFNCLFLTEIICISFRLISSRAAMAINLSSIVRPLKKERCECRFGSQDIPEIYSLLLILSQIGSWQFEQIKGSPKIPNNKHNHLGMPALYLSLHSKNVSLTSKRNSIRSPIKLDRNIPTIKEISGSIINTVLQMRIELLLTVEKQTEKNVTWLT